MDLSPKDIRISLYASIRDATDGSLVGVVMDAALQRRGEDHDKFFCRLEEEHNVVSYFFIIPTGCKLAGTFVEEGMLLWDFHHGRRPDIVLFLEHGLAGGSEEKGFVFHERGNRTRYLESVVAKARNVLFWPDIAHLEALVVRQALALFDG